MSDRVESWDPSRWRRRKPWPAGEPVPDGAESGAADVLDAQADRAYRPGALYAVFVPSPFARANPDAEPVLRYRVCADPGDREAGRAPVFLSAAEWAATCGTDAEARLAELERQIEELEGVPECYSVKRAAHYLDLSEKTVYKLVRERELHAFQVGGQYRIPAEALEELKWKRSAAPATDAEDADPAPPLFNPNFRRDAAG